MTARTKVNLNDFSIGLGGSSTPVLPATLGRNFLLVKNNGPGAAAVNFLGGTAALATRANVQLASGQQIKFEKNVPQTAVSAISASNSTLTVYADDSASAFWLLNGNSPPAVDLDFRAGRYFNNGLFLTAPITNTRVTTGGSATDLLPSSASGASFTTFANSVPRLTQARGLLIEPAATNNLQNSTVPATQSPTLGVATFTLWVNGAGSVQATAGTATAAALPLTATQGSPITFAVTVGGTVVCTVTPPLNSFQLETGSFPTSLIVTAGATGTRNADVISTPMPSALSSVYSIYQQGTPLQTVANTVFQVLTVLDDGTANNRIRIGRQNITGLDTFTIAAGGIGQTNILSILTLPVNVSSKVAANVSAGSQNASLNGAAVVSDVGGTLATGVLNYRIGNDTGGNNQFNGYIERVALWPSTFLPNATLVSMST